MSFNNIDFKYIYNFTIILVMTIIMAYVIDSIVEDITYNKYDVNQDGKINAQDYVEIKNYIMESCTIDEK